VKAEVTSHYPDLSIHRVVYPLPSDPPLVSIIIPTKNHVDLLSQCLDGILNHTSYNNLEVIVVDNGSTDPKTIAYFKEIDADKRIQILHDNSPFNYSAINNMAVKHARGDVLCFLNNDIKIIAPDWLTEMVSQALRKEIGAVGSRLYYANDTIQHTGVFLGFRGKAGHLFRYMPRHCMGQWARAVLVQNMSAVTAACLVIRKEVFEAVGGFEERLTITFNDVDLCLRIAQSGYRNLYTPFAELYHLESVTRKMMAYAHEESFFQTQWQHALFSDPAYNPNLTLEKEDLSPAFPPRIYRPWFQFESDSLPLVSIVTRTYGNRQEFLQQAIESVQSQVYRPIQLIVVEDGTENARQVIKSVKTDSRFTIDYFPLPKGGRCRAGNYGLKSARGQFVGFLDDDDLLLSDHILTLAVLLLENPAACGAYASSLECPTRTLSLHPLVLEEKQKKWFGAARFSRRSLWHYNYIPIQAILFRRECYEKYGGLEERLDCLEDWDLWLRYTAERDFVSTDKPTSIFRMPADENILLARRDQHITYLPELRKRQKALVEKYRDTPYFTELESCCKAIDSGS
jgi:glycosyltransferase involved in cell wall biosynthesis